MTHHLSMQRQAERLLGISLPEGVRDVQAHRWKPSPDLAMYEGYIRFEASPEDYRTVLERLGIAEKDTRHPLATSRLWDLPAGVEVDWWDASEDTPQEGVVADYGTNGWIAVKQEDGRVYIALTDTGSKEGSPGPW